MILNLKTIFLIGVVLTIAGCWKDRTLDVNTPIKEVEESLNERIPALMKKNSVVGLSVVVIRDNELKLSQSFGYSNIDLKQKVNQGTVYQAASLGKPIFAYIVATLASQKKIDIDKPLYLYTGVGVVPSDSRSKEITARMVLSHTTGLPNLGAQKAPKFLFKPGEKFEYSGHGYQYLQRVVEALTKTTLNELATEIVFKPLLMAESSYRWRKDYKGVISKSYGDSNLKLEVNQKVKQDHAAWSLYTTPEDYSKFVAHIMRSSRDSGSVASQLLKPMVNVAKGVKWGLGWGIQDTNPYQSFWHWGSMDGFKHYVVAYPEEQIAVVVMSNTKKAFKIVNKIMAQSIGGSFPSYDWF